MENYSFYISVCHTDGTDIARKIEDALKSVGYQVIKNDLTMLVTPLKSVFSSINNRGTYSSPHRSAALSNYIKASTEKISGCDCVIAIITDKYGSTDYTLKELELTNERAKKLIPILCTEDLCESLQTLLSDDTVIKLNEEDDVSETLIPHIKSTVNTQIESEILYEKLSEYSRLKLKNRETTVICNLISIALQKYKSASTDKNAQYRQNLAHICEQTGMEIYRLFSRMASYNGNYDSNSREISELILKTIGDINEFMTSICLGFFTNNLLLCSVALRIIYMEKYLIAECDDILSNGNAKPRPSADYTDMQAPFAAAYSSLLVTKADSYSNADLQFIDETVNFILERAYSDNTKSHQSEAADTKNTMEHVGNEIPNPVIPAKPENSNSVYETEAKEKTCEDIISVISHEDALLHRAAELINQSNRLFDKLLEQNTDEELVKYLMTSYERLKNYCEIVGASDVAADCIDRLAEIKSMFINKKSESTADKKAENGLKALLGLSSRSTNNYDVFISYKSEDSDLAKVVYNYFKENMVEAFWSKVSLPELSKSEYEDNIYKALAYSKHFVVVLSDLSYMESNWVKAEMTMFHREINEGRKTNSNFIILVTDELYGRIISGNKEDLPIQYRGYQIVKMSEFRITLLKYIK